MTREAGYYWYFSSPLDVGDFATDEPQIVYVHDYGWISICGSDMPYDESHAKGTFEGPLQPPVAPEPPQR